MEPCATRLLRRPRLLIVGCGDVGLRVLRLLHGRWRVLAVTSSPQRRGLLRAAGATPLVGRPRRCGLAGAAGAAGRRRAAPGAAGRRMANTIARTAALLAALARGGGVRRLVYASTSGVYGDCAGARVHETRALNPCTDRACRRADAESRVRALRPRVRRARDDPASARHLRVRPRQAGIRASGCAAVHPRWWSRTMCSPTTSMPTTWRARAWPRCCAGRRCARSTSPTTTR